jgi:hypothetical protein
MARSDDDLRGMLADLESDLVERKESTSATDKIAEAICAYSNDLPGYHTSGVVFVGATDDGRPSGLAVTDRILLSLAGIRVAISATSPSPSLRLLSAVDIHSERGGRAGRRDRGGPSGDEHAGRSRRDHNVSLVRDRAHISMSL